MLQSMKVLCMLFYFTLRSNAMDGECETSIISLKARIDVLENKEEVHLTLIRDLRETLQEIKDGWSTLMLNIVDLKSTVKEQGKMIKAFEKQKPAVVYSSHGMKTKADKMEPNSTRRTSNKVKRSQNSVILDSAAQFGMTRQTTTNIDRMVAFHATIDMNQNYPYAVSHLTVGQTIVFNSVKLNLGRGYHSSTGLFIAPIAGTYMFSASVMTKGEIQLNIVHNGAPLAGVFASNRQQGSVTIATQLQVGDEVLVKVQSPNDAYIWGDRLTSFMGCLISTA